MLESSLLPGRVPNEVCVGVGGTGTDAALPTDPIVAPILPGKGGRGIAGGGDGSEAAEVDLRKLELERFVPGTPGSPLRSSNLAYGC